MIISCGGISRVALSRDDVEQNTFFSFIWSIKNAVDNNLVWVCHLSIYSFFLLHCIDTTGILTQKNYPKLIGSSEGGKLYILNI